nr:PREDICTED: E3 ubiquitin-protein ligase UBR3 isoform X2 [Bemisia tabaci]
MKLWWRPQKSNFLAMENPSPAAHVLMKKGKRGAAAYVHSDCAIKGSNRLLNEVLDILLNPRKSINEWETIDWLKWLMAGGKTPDEFSNLVRRYDHATKCGLVWTANFVAYRCRTCGISPCMSLCADCFQKGDHDGHDFNMFRSQAGGACDCGDASVMQVSGFCERHGLQAQVNRQSVDSLSAPPDLMCVAEAVMPRIILRLIQHLREKSKLNTFDAHLIQDHDDFLTMLHDLSRMGAPMRRVLIGALTNPQIYKNLTELLPSDESEYASYLVDSQNTYEEALKTLPNPPPPPEYKYIPGLQENLSHSTFLEELVFWTVKFEFPQKIVCLLLNMLPDQEYKESLTHAFVLHYSRISMMLERSSDPDTLSNRVVHVSVQLFSNKTIASTMVENLYLLHVMVISLKYMMQKILIPNVLHNAEKNMHFVVDCSQQVMKDHCYWPLVSDLNNVLSHQPVAQQFMSDDSLLEMWFVFLSMFQGMNVNQQEMSQHVEFEPNTYYAAFSAELEASAYPMWALVSHLHDSSTVSYTKRVLDNCLTALQDWFDAIGMSHPNLNDARQVSFHLPLHRHLSVFMCQAVNVQGVPLSEVLPPLDMLHLIMMHPLRVQVAFYEIINGLWVRNGLQIKGQAMTYIQCNFCNSMVDADLYLLQICAMQLPTDVFMQTVIDKFHIQECFSFTSTSSSDSTEIDSLMFESFLIFIASLISIRTNLGTCQMQLSQLEMVTLLCKGDTTHSQLMELMPERCGTDQSRDFEAILAEVADYRAPNFEASGNMQQGMYIPKGRVWEELYDPIHILLRAVHRPEYQTSLDRFTEYVTQKNQQQGKPTLDNKLWPPFRPPGPVLEAYKDPRRILTTKIFHAVIWIGLYKAVHQSTISENVMALIVYLLEMALSVVDPTQQYGQVCSTAPCDRRDVKDLDLADWFISDWLSDNLRTIIGSVTLMVEPLYLESSDTDDDWERIMYDNLLRTPALPALENGSNISALPIESSSQEAGPTGQEVALAPSALLSSKFLVRAGTGSSGGSSSSGSSSSNMPSGNQAAIEMAPQHQQMMIPVIGNEVVPLPSTSTNTEMIPRLPTSHQKTGTRRAKGAPYLDGTKTPSGSIVVEANESIISLLLKLHSHLSGAPDSFLPDVVESSTSGKPTPGTSGASSSSSSCQSHLKQESNDSRIGDGPFFIAKVLKKIMELDELCRENVIATRDKLWPRQPGESEKKRKVREELEKIERRRRARERQQKLMEEFASKQKQFLQKAMETDEEGMDWDSEEPTKSLCSKVEYDCVICNQTTPTTEDKPMGLAVLVQATSVLGHKRRHPEPTMLPTCDEERLNLRRDDSLASDFDRKVEELARQFDNLSWLVSVNLGWEGGVHVQTCGHHLHLDCLKSYLCTLVRTQHRMASDRGEYQCPLCRQMANSVLPLPPQLGEGAAMVRSRPLSIGAMALELTGFLKLNPKQVDESKLAAAMSKAMEDMNSATFPKFRQKSSSPVPQTPPQTLFLFVSSIARTNLEIEVVQRGGNLVVQQNSNPLDAMNLSAMIPKRSCITPLLYVLAMHAGLLAHWPVWRTWQQLAGIQNDSVTAIAPMEREVPLMLRDPTALLTQLILLLPLHLDQAYFSVVVKLLYNLLYFQITAQISCGMSETERHYWRCSSKALSWPLNTLEQCISVTINKLDPTQLYLEDDAEMISHNIDFNFVPDKVALENKIQELCLPFLRVATLLRHHLYEEPLPEILSTSEEFLKLVYYLELVPGGMDLSQFNAAVALSSPTNNLDFIYDWINQLSVFINRSQVAARSFLSELHITWHQPCLLSLPSVYDKIFQYYHRKQCFQCHSVPRETSICLLCGTLVCLKESCCKQSNICEAIQHSIDCGAGTAMFLVVPSSYIIVVRGKRACLWGSVYLDSFGEEDRELKRGKPLYLSPERYRLLQQQWLAHRFDHTNKKWVWHRDAL